MTNSFDFFDNQDRSKDSPIIRERVSLVATHMYKQFMDYQKANMNTAEIFNQMLECLDAVVGSMQQTFESHGVVVNRNEGIDLDIDAKKTTAVLTIFWNKVSFTTRCNFQPQSLFRGETEQPLSSGRIMALKGNYHEIIKNAQTQDEEMKALLDNELASLYVPEDKSKSTVFKVRHRSGREFPLPHIDAAREFVLGCIEVVCGNNVYHKEGMMKSFNI